MNVKSIKDTIGPSLISLGIAGMNNPAPILGTGTPVESKLCERYSLGENPFGNTPDPRYLYQSETHREALSSLFVGIECGVGFQALIAVPGMGKTTLLFHLLSRFWAVDRTAFLFQIQANSHELLRNFLCEMGIDADRADRVGMHEQIRRALAREAQAGRRTILVIDEAQSLEPPVLETIRMLSNVELPNKKLLQIILAGQPQLAETLARPELAQLYQRIWTLARIAPLGFDDVKQYVAHRLEVAGNQGTQLFTEKALRLVWEASRGIPRNINRLCFNALLAGASSKNDQLDENCLREVAADLDLDASFQSVSSSVQACNDSTGENGLEAIIKRTKALTGARALAILLLDGDGLVCHARAGSIAPPLGFRAGASNGLTGECIRSGKNMRCHNSEKDPRVDLEMCRQVGIKSIVAVPLWDGHNIIGVLEIYSSETNAFASLGMPMVQTIGSDVVATLNRAGGGSPASGAGDTSMASTRIVSKKESRSDSGTPFVRALMSAD